MWGRRVLPTALPTPFSATLSPALSVYLRKCGAAGSASGQTACPVRPTLHQSRSRHSRGSPPPRCPSPPLLPVWMNVYFFISLVSDFLAFRFSVSSGCARRRSVSTYTAILVLSNIYSALFLCPLLYPVTWHIDAAIFDKKSRPQESSNSRSQSP